MSESFWAENGLVSRGGAVGISLSSEEISALVDYIERVWRRKYFESKERRGKF